MRYGRQLCRNCLELKRVNRQLQDELTQLKWTLFEVTYDIDNGPRLVPDPNKPKVVPIRNGEEEPPPPPA